MFPKVFEILVDRNLEPTVMIALDEAGERRVLAHVVKDSLKFIPPAGRKPTFDTAPRLTSEMREAGQIPHETIEALPEGIRARLKKDRQIAFRTLANAVARWEMIKLRDELAHMKIEEIAEFQEDGEYVADSLAHHLFDIYDEARDFRGDPLFNVTVAQIA